MNTNDVYIDQSGRSITMLKFRIKYNDLECTVLKTCYIRNANVLNVFVFKQILNVVHYTLNLHFF